MAIYHLNVSTGSKGKGSSAGAKFDYIEREGKYEKGKEELQEVGHGNMPEWAVEKPKIYWESADDFERANARLFRQVEFALPVELNREQQKKLVEEFAKFICDDESLPYSWAIHKGEYNHKGEQEDKPKNPHCHLIISERRNDGIFREPEHWFKQTSNKNPARGGAPKTKKLESKDWLFQIRKDWENFANKALQEAGHNIKIDCRSLAEQGIERAPSRHRGVSEKIAKSGRYSERWEEIKNEINSNQEIRLLEFILEQKKDEIIRIDEQLSNNNKILYPEEQIKLEIDKLVLLKKDNEKLSLEIRNLMKEKEDLEKEGAKQVKEYKQAEKTINELNEAFLGSIRHKGEITRLQELQGALKALNQTTVAQWKTVEQDLEALKTHQEARCDEIRACEGKIKEALENSVQKAIMGFSDENKERWREIDAQTKRQNHDVVQLVEVTQERLKRFLQAPEQIYQELFGYRDRFRSRGRGFSR